MPVSYVSSGSNDFFVAYRSEKPAVGEGYPKGSSLVVKLYETNPPYQRVFKTTILINGALSRMEIPPDSEDICMQIEDEKYKGPNFVKRFKTLDRKELIGNVITLYPPSPLYEEDFESMDMNSSPSDDGILLKIQSIKAFLDNQ